MNRLQAQGVVVLLTSGLLCGCMSGRNSAPPGAGTGGQRDTLAQIVPPTPAPALYIPGAVPLTRPLMSASLPSPPASSAPLASAPPPTAPPPSAPLADAPLRSAPLPPPALARMQPP